MKAARSDKGLSCVSTRLPAMQYICTLSRGLLGREKMGCKQVLKLCDHMCCKQRASAPTGALALRQ